jgi:hypothetical protein
LNLHCCLVYSVHLGERAPAKQAGSFMKGGRVSKKKLLAVVGVVALITVVGLVMGGIAIAQSETPPAQTVPATPGNMPWGKGFGCMGAGGWNNFDAMAKALNLTPTQLFEKLHEGKTLADIATEQGVDLTKVQEAANAERVQAMKDAIAQAVKDGKITQAQADWMLQGLEQGYMGKGRGFGFDGMGGRGMRGFRGGPGMHGFWGERAPKQAPSAPTPSQSSWS